MDIPKSKTNMPYRPTPAYYSPRTSASPLPAVAAPSLRGGASRQPARRRGHGKLIAALLLLLVGVFVFHSMAGHKAKVHAQVKPSLPPVGDAALATFGTNINSIIAQHPTMDIAVQTIDLDANKAESYGSSDSFTAGSTAKILTAMAYLHGVEDGQYSLTQHIGGQTAQQALKALIVDSDDTAWLNFNTLMTHDYLQSYGAALGMVAYDPTDNTMPASDVAVLLQKLYSGYVLNNDDTRLLLGFLKQANYRSYIVAAVPSDYTVYHKVGIVADELHDSSIIAKDGRSVVLVIFTKGNGDYDMTTRAALVHKITAATLHAYFNEPLAGSAAPVASPAPMVVTPSGENGSSNQD